jgi:hypothetical protein
MWTSFVRVEMFFVSRRGLGGTCLRATRPTRAPILTSFRPYATKNKANAKHTLSQPEVKGSHATSTSGLIPTSKRALKDETAQAEYDKAATKMVAAVNWLKKEVAGIKARGLGHVTPAVLDPVRVVLPEDPKEHRLEEVASVGIRDGINLIVTLYEDTVRSYGLRTTVLSRSMNIRSLEPEICGEGYLYRKNTECCTTKG